MRNLLKIMSLRGGRAGLWIHGVWLQSTHSNLLHNSVTLLFRHSENLCPTKPSWKKNYLRTYYSKLKKKFRKQWHWPGVKRFQDLSSTACLENQNRKSERKFYCTNCMIKTQKFLTVKWWHKFSFQEKSKAIENSILSHFLEWNKRECLEHSHSKGTDLITQTLLSTWTQSLYLLLQTIVTYSIL